MTNYCFILGFAYTLCKAELFSQLDFFCSDYSVVLEEDPVVIISTSDAIDTKKLFERLGGTIKIGVVIEKSTFEVEDILTTLSQYTPKTRDVGISNYLGKTLSLEKILKSLQTLWQTKNIKTRYVLPQKDPYLSSVVVQKQKLTELMLISSPDPAKIFIAETQTVQDSDEWSKRDFGRPFADAKSGMLPLKVARMMVNLARLDYEKTPLVLDPFCGMGSIVTESLLLGCRAVGSDLVPEVIQKTQGNISWLQNKYPDRQFDFKFLVSDAVHVAKSIGENKIDAVVTEPFLGAPFEKRGERLLQKGKPATAESVHNVFRGLEKLYIGAFKNWKLCLKNDGKVVITIPEVTLNGQVFTVKNLIDNCEKLGYTLERGPFEYARAHAVVKRQIYIFKKT